MRDLLRTWQNAKRFRSLPNERRSIVFYSEGSAYTKYFRPVITALIRNHGVTLAYLTSDPADPLLLSNDPRIEAFYIGAGSARTFIFQMLRARILIMTMPDLETFHIKRSSVHAVHYAYIQHSMVSTHMIYREGAFDHFDSVLCAGPHQVNEILAWEKHTRLPEKKLFEHGYAPIDSLLELKRSISAPRRAHCDSLRVLVAPSWGPEGLLESGADALVEALLRAGYHVRVRPHQRTLKNSPTKVNALSRRFQRHPGFEFDIDATSLRTLLDFDVMISDWSGVAMEFAFGLERPVLFIDTPRKVNNPRWSEIGIAPLEVFYRNQVGAILEPCSSAAAPTMVRRLYECSDAIAERARLLRTKFVYNAGNSGKYGAKIIADLAS